MHLKLGLMKHFVKAMNQEEFPFTYEKVSQIKRGKTERKYFIVHKYETLSTTNTSISSFKATNSGLGLF